MMQEKASAVKISHQGEKRAEMTGVGLIAFGVPRLGHSRLNKDPFERPQRRKCARIAACVGMVVGRVFAHNRRTRTRQLHDVKI